MSIVRWIIAVLVVGLVGVCAVQSLKPRPRPPTEVQMVKVSKATITRTVSGAGKLEPLTKVNVSANITGTLVDLAVGIGSEVKKDQYLGQIDASRYQAQVEGSRASAAAAVAGIAREDANLARLRQDLERMEKLAKAGVSNSSDLEQARSAVRVGEAQLRQTRSQADMAKAGLREVQNNLTWSTLKAPVDGTVLAVNHRVGERIRGSELAEDVILVLGSLSKMDVRIEVGEHDVVHVHPHQKARIEIDALPDVVLSGEVIDSGRDAIIKNLGTDNEVTTYPVWVSLDNPPQSVLSGMSAQVIITTETQEGVVSVPIQAVTVRPLDPKAPPAVPAGPGGAKDSKTEKVVFVVKDGKAERRKVQTGISSDTLVEIKSGLADGEQVVEGPYRILARQLSDGDPVIEEQKGGPGKPGPAGGGP